jgi:hypothetical protein
VILYHRTRAETAERIKTEGFRDGSGTYLSDTVLTGVWLSNIPLDGNEGAYGDVLLEVNIDLPAADMDYYECVEEDKPYREWLIPAERLNAHSTLKEVSEKEVD